MKIKKATKDRTLVVIVLASQMSLSIEPLAKVLISEADRVQPNELETIFTKNTRVEQSTAPFF